MKITDHLFTRTEQKLFTEACSFVRYSDNQKSRGIPLLDIKHTQGERAWNISQKTGIFLYHFITHIGAVRALELGTSLGYSTLWITAGLHENNADEYHCDTCEKNPQKIALAQHYLEPLFGSHISFHNGTITSILNNLIDAYTQPYDIIFFDADRGNYKIYWQAIQTLLHTRSIIIVDNALRIQKSVQEFQDFIKTLPGWVTYLHPYESGLFIVTRQDGPYNDLGNIISQL